MRRAPAAAAAFFWCGAAAAQQFPMPRSDPPSGREYFLAATIVAMMLLGLASFLLRGRVTESTHVALALLAVLAGGFGLLVLLGGALYEGAAAGVAVLLLLACLFKLMSQFEAGRRPPKA